jgi:plasmid stability protein
MKLHRQVLEVDREWRSREAVGVSCGCAQLVHECVVTRPSAMAKSPLVAFWYQSRYHRLMAMTLRLDDDESAALRRRAEHEGRSMQDVARQAVREYIERTSRRELLDQVLDEELPRYAEALERLGQ